MIKFWKEYFSKEFLFFEKLGDFIILGCLSKSIPSSILSSWLLWLISGRKVFYQNFSWKKCWCEQKIFSWIFDYFFTEILKSFSRLFYQPISFSFQITWKIILKILNFDHLVNRKINRLKMSIFFTKFEKLWIAWWAQKILWKKISSPGNLYILRF